MRVVWSFLNTLTSFFAISQSSYDIFKDALIIVMTLKILLLCVAGKDRSRPLGRTLGRCQPLIWDIQLVELSWHDIPACVVFSKARWACSLLNLTRSQSESKVTEIQNTGSPFLMEEIFFVCVSPQTCRHCFFSLVDHVYSELMFGLPVQYLDLCGWNLFVCVLHSILLCGRAAHTAGPNPHFYHHVCALSGFER